MPPVYRSGCRQAQRHGDPSFSRPPPVHRQHSAAHPTLIVELKCLGAVHVVCESTGGYERVHWCSRQLRPGIAVNAINARQIRDFERACGYASPRPTNSRCLIDAHIAAQADLAAKTDRLQQVCGVGRVTALTVVALMPELGTPRDNEAAALADVAPMNRDSGQHRGRRHIHGGRAARRRVLYMTALTATVHNSYPQSVLSSPPSKR
ncbi:MAG: IS110 family transposase [Verrucomicrobia bacterium]|nr:IS110 family transposase [Verrucomicrobiota bacterium]